jgi:hypothetical protein
MTERGAVAYQRVHTVMIMEEFPRSIAGKTLKRVMYEPYRCWVARVDRERELMSTWPQAS